MTSNSKSFEGASARLSTADYIQKYPTTSSHIRGECAHTNLSMFLESTSFGLGSPISPPAHVLGNQFISSSKNSAGIRSGSAPSFTCQFHAKQSSNTGWNYRLPHGSNCLAAASGQLSPQSPSFQFHHPVSPISPVNNNNCFSGIVEQISPFPTIRSPFTSTCFPYSATSLNQSPSNNTTIFNNSRNQEIHQQENSFLNDWAANTQLSVNSSKSSSFEIPSNDLKVVEFNLPDFDPGESESDKTHGNFFNDNGQLGPFTDLDVFSSHLIGNSLISSSRDDNKLQQDRHFDGSIKPFSPMKHIMNNNDKISPFGSNSNLTKTTTLNFDKNIKIVNCNNKINFQESKAHNNNYPHLISTNRKTMAIKVPQKSQFLSLIKQEDFFKHQNSQPIKIVNDLKNINSHLINLPENEKTEFELMNFKEKYLFLQNKEYYENFENDFCSKNYNVHQKNDEKPFISHTTDNDNYYNSYYHRKNHHENIVPPYNHCSFTYSDEKKSPKLFNEFCKSPILTNENASKDFYHQLHHHDTNTILKNQHNIPFLMKKNDTFNIQQNKSSSSFEPFQVSQIHVVNNNNNNKFEKKDEILYNEENKLQNIYSFPEKYGYLEVIPTLTPLEILKDSPQFNNCSDHFFPTSPSNSQNYLKNHNSPNSPVSSLKQPTSPYNKILANNYGRSRSQILNKSNRNILINNDGVRRSVNDSQNYNNFQNILNSNNGNTENNQNSTGSLNGVFSRRQEIICKIVQEPKHIYVAELPVHADEGIVKNLFKRFGRIDDIRLAKSKSTGQLNGVAFVKFTFSESVLLALENDNKITIGSRKLRVARTDPLDLPTSKIFFANVWDMSQNDIVPICRPFGLIVHVDVVAERGMIYGLTINHRYVRVEYGQAFGNNEIIAKKNFAPQKNAVIESVYSSHSNEKKNNSNSQQFSLQQNLKTTVYKEFTTTAIVNKSKEISDCFLDKKSLENTQLAEQINKNHNAKKNESVLKIKKANKPGDSKK